MNCRCKNVYRHARVPGAGNEKRKRKKNRKEKTGEKCKNAARDGTTVAVTIVAKKSGQRDFLETLHSSDNKTRTHLFRISSVQNSLCNACCKDVALLISMLKSSIGSSLSETVPHVEHLI